MKKVVLYFLFFCFISYLSFLYILPCIINHTSLIDKIILIANKKTGLDFTYKNLYFKSNYNLSINLKVDEAEVKNKNKQRILFLQKLNINYKPLNKISTEINYLIFDKTNFTQNKKSKKKKRDKFPNITIKKADIILQKDFLLTLENLKTQDKSISFKGTGFSKYLSSKIIINEKEHFFIKNNSLYANISFNFINATLNLKGELAKPDFTLSGKDIKTKDIKECFLVFMKTKQPGKKNFIENFYDFKGTADIDLKFKNKSIEGSAALKNFEFKSVKFSVPFYFNNAIFVFNKDKVHLKTFGLFGKEKLYCDFFANDIFTPDKVVLGSLASNIGQNFAKKYIPGLKITKRVDLFVRYIIKNHKPEVEYIMDIKKGANIGYKNTTLNFIEKNRKIYAKTLKEKENLHLKTYKVLIENKKILFGEGLFVRKNNKLKLDNISINTNDYVPIFLITGFNNFIKEGYFKGNLKYFAKNKYFIGNLDIKNAKYKNFIIKNASIKALSKMIEIKAFGLLDNAACDCYIKMKNNLEKIHIYDIYLHLNEYKLKRQGKHKKENRVQASKKSNNKGFIIEKGKLKLDKLSFRNIILKNLNLNCRSKGDLLFFDVENIDFAKGYLNAKGSYDTKNQSSDILFNAQKVNSNLAANEIFNLKNQFEGLANAKMHFKSENKLEKIKAHCNFEITNGQLKIASSEFLASKINDKNSIISKIKKFTNINLNSLENAKSDIKGDFDIDNTKVKNIELFSQNKSLSTYTKGNYNIKNEYACLCMWGAYNKETLKGIKILFIPLLWITKIVFKNENSLDLYKKEIEKIPKIESKSNQKEIIFVTLDGDINDSSKLNFNLKSLK